MVRRTWVLMTVIVVVLVLVAACEPATPEIVEREVVEEVQVEKEVETVVVEEAPVEVEKEVVTFVVWATRGDFERQKFQELADTFYETSGIEVNLVFLNER